jgi:protein gp37
MSDRYWQLAWSLVDGCTPVSEGCEHCWSKALHDRFQKESFLNISIREGRLEIPLRTKKPTVWSIWNDFLHNAVPESFICTALDIMAGCPKHTFLILTKREKRLEKIIEWWYRNEKSMLAIPDNIWTGVTAENQQRADERISCILQVPGKRFFSLEPLLGSINLRKSICNCPWFEDAEKTRHLMGCSFFPIPETFPIHAVIVGCETGPGHRPCKLEWIESIVQQCKDAGVPCFVKAININGKVIRDIDKFPKHLQVRELPWSGG